MPPATTGKPETERRQRHTIHVKLLQAMFDTLAITRGLTAAGIDQKHAEAHAKAMAAAFRETEKETPSKTDFNELKADFGVLKTDFNELKADFGVLKTDFNELKADFGVLKAEFVALKASVNALKESTDTQFRAIKWLLGAHLGLTLVLLAAILGG